VKGYIHPFFNLHLVTTFRSSSNSPNFQNVPKRDELAKNTCRGALFPRPGHQLVEIDYGALEVSIAATFHKDPVMIKYLKAGKDFHGDIAKQIFFIDEKDYNKKKFKLYRNAAKNGFTFPEFYGDYYKNCAESLAFKWCQLPECKRWKKGQGTEWPDGGNISDHLIENGIKNIDDFIEHIQDLEYDLWTNRFPVYAKWKEKHWKRYQKNGYIDTNTGFRCSGVMKKNDVINYPVQGSAFHCMLWSFIQVDKIIIDEKLDSKLIGQVHDSMVLDVNPKELDYIIKTVKRITCIELPKVFTWINVPLKVDEDIYPVDGSWTDKIN
jgi:DNA polymerase-1